jgi:hypothetical protein
LINVIEMIPIQANQKNEFLFELYEKYTEDLFTVDQKKKKSQSNSN